MPISFGKVPFLSQNYGFCSWQICNKMCGFLYDVVSWSCGLFDAFSFTFFGVCFDFCSDHKINFHYILVYITLICIESYFCSVIMIFMFALNWIIITVFLTFDEELNWTSWVGQELCTWLWFSTEIFCSRTHTHTRSVLFLFTNDFFIAIFCTFDLATLSFPCTMYCVQCAVDLTRIFRPSEFYRSTGWRS